jgi:hypothetical protein
MDQLGAALLVSEMKMPDGTFRPALRLKVCLTS